MMKLRSFLDWFRRIPRRALARARLEASSSRPAAGASAVAQTNGRPPSTNDLPPGWTLGVLDPSDPIFSMPIIIGWPHRGQKRTPPRAPSAEATQGPGELPKNGA